MKSRGNHIEQTSPPMQVEFWSNALRETCNAEKSTNIASAVRKWVSNALSQRSLSPFCNVSFRVHQGRHRQKSSVISYRPLLLVFVSGQEIFGLLKMENTIFVPRQEMFWLFRVGCIRFHSKQRQTHLAAVAALSSLVATATSASSRPMSLPPSLAFE